MLFVEIKWKDAYLRCKKVYICRIFQRKVPSDVGYPHYYLIGIPDLTSRRGLPDFPTRPTPPEKIDFTLIGEFAAFFLWSHTGATQAGEHQSKVFYIDMA